jgi:hypothetical protein
MPQRLSGMLPSAGWGTGLFGTLAAGLGTDVSDVA